MNWVDPGFVFSSKPGFGFGGFSRQRRYSRAAEAVVSASSEDDDEIHGFVEKLEVEKEADLREFEMKGRSNTGGMMQSKYNALKKRQVKMETEAWGEAVKEYQELLTDMYELKPAPNFPYIKSLFLGWFEPLRGRILKEQEPFREAKNCATCTPHFDQLPLVGGDADGCLLSGWLLQRAISAKIHKFLEKAKRKDATNSQHDDKAGAKERLNKKFKSLIKQKKTRQLKKIVQAHDDSGPWGQDAQAKIGARLIELLIETAYIQPPADQIGDGTPDIRPAFIHRLKTITTELHKRFGVIECDPLVRKGLEKSARHMVIPYMPMLVPPLNWTGYSKGAYLFLPSYMMRSQHVGQYQMESNKRVLGTIDRIWATGGRLGDLVDRDDVPLPEEPDTDDEAKFKQWKWKVRVVKRENNERYAQRCDTEFKLAVRGSKNEGRGGLLLPNNLDFRGRAYPMHAYLNHLGSDLCQGILEFAEGRPLGKSDLRWLKIHLAN
ncbi:DNA-directed RNA polymerase 1B, mitochondrial-like protein [Drosera capensis]